MFPSYHQLLQHKKKSDHERNHQEKAEEEEEKKQKLPGKMALKSKKFQITLLKFKTKPPPVIQIVTILPQKKQKFYQMKVKDNQDKEEEPCSSPKCQTKHRLGYKNVNWAACDYAMIGGTYFTLALQIIASNTLLAKNV